MDTDEARGGSTPNIVRWVLAIGILLAIVGLSLSWIIPAMSRNGETRHASVSGQINAARENDGSDTDSIITPEQANPNASGVPPEQAAQGNEGGVPTVANGDKGR